MRWECRFPFYLFNPETHVFLLYGEVCDCVDVCGKVWKTKTVLEVKKLLIMFGNMAFFGRCWLWLEETLRRCQREVIECDTSSALMSGWLAGPRCRNFFPQGLSKSLNVLYVIVKVCSPSVPPWTSAKQNSKSSHLAPCLSTHSSQNYPWPIWTVFCQISSQPQR